MTASTSTRWQHDPAEAWLAWQPSADDPWDLFKVLRLHRRAGLGATWAQVQRDVAAGHETALAEMLSGAPTSPDGRPAETIDRFCEAMLTSYDMSGAALDSIRQAWFYRLVFSAWPLRERMILAWHSHYATSETKVSGKQILLAEHLKQRTLWRSRASELQLAMLGDEAMLNWLDGTANRRAAPNENLAREFLELFALGIGNYSERDVRETARALTGWQRVYNLPSDIEFVAALQDTGEKTILGQTGPWLVKDVVRIACAQPAAARRVAWRLWRTFVSDIDEPSAELVEGLAATMRVDGDVDVARGLETLIRSRLFHSDAYVGRRILSPVEWLASVSRCGETFPPHPDLAEVVAAANRIGQRLFRPPTVAGWPGGMEWLGGTALVARQNFAAWLTSAESSVPIEHWQRLATRYGHAGGDAELDFWTSLFWGRPADAAAKQKLSKHLDAREPTALVRALLLSPAAYLA